MALSINQAPKIEHIRIISKKDSAIDWDQTSASDWEEYEKDPMKNAEKVVCKADVKPTTFIFNFGLKGKEEAAIKDAMVKGVDDEQDVKFSYGKWEYTVVKLTLKDIENPPGTDGAIVMKKDPKGYVHDSVMDKLAKLDLISEFHGYYNRLTKSEEDGQEKN